MADSLLAFMRTELVEKCGLTVLIRSSRHVPCGVSWQNPHECSNECQNYLHFFPGKMTHFSSKVNRVTLAQLYNLRKKGHFQAK
jgi:hypothetical protein